MKKFWQSFKKWFFRIALAFLILSVLSVVIFRFLPIPVTPLMIKRCGQQLFSGREMTLKKDWVSLEEISPSLPLAVIASEDQNFLNHHGFDFKAIEKAMKNNEKRGKRRLKGASTISQQTAKNVFLWEGRSYLRKGFEVYFTALIELFWSKERIIEVYLNVIETGDGVYGAEATAKTYFRKSAKKLSNSESATIAALLPSPIRYSKNINGSYISSRRNWIMRQMANLGSTVSFER